MKDLMEVLPQIGLVEWIGVRPGRKLEMHTLNAVKVNTEEGLEGDRYQGKSGTRQVTLIQAEHIEGVASMLGKPSISPNLIRRNIVVRGINLLALKDRQFQIGDEVVLQTTGLCHPCSRMEQNLGSGGYNAMRGHGGITAQVIHGGEVKIGDPVKMINEK